MAYVKINNVLEIVASLMEKYIKKNNIVVDCTLGNGNDSLKLLELLDNTGFLYGFDIQKKAIENTNDLLKDYNNFKLINDSHEYIDKYINEKVDFIVYNLGYLPGGDKNITTVSDSTLVSIKKSMELLKENGTILIVTYPGHNAGKEENDKIYDMLINIDQRQFNVLKHEFINQKNNPPILYELEKNKTR